MHRENHFYGHAAILAAYAGLERPRPIPGHLQHGWQHGSGVVPDCVRTRWPKLVWSRRNLEACQREGVRSPRPIGAPFLYLPPVAEAGPARGERSLLAFPFHGWPGAEITALGEMYAAYAASLAELRREGFDEITVCMYWLEYAREELRAVFEREGLRVVTAGRGREDARFLHVLRDLIREHGHTTSNRIATASFYALASDRPFFLRGPVMGLRGNADPVGDRIRKREEREFPSLGFETYGGHVEAEIGARELGAEYRRSPGELRDALDWSRSGFLPVVGQQLRMGSWRLARWIWRAGRGLRRRFR